jgi:hypothetical protein
MHRLGQRIRFTGIVRGVVTMATLAILWVAAGAPFDAAF